MFNLINDPLETNNLLQGTLTTNEQNLKSELENEANQRITAWSCKDDIQNGNEQGIDCGGTYCLPCSTTSTNDSINSISVYPNPAKNNFVKIRIHVDSANHIECEIYDLAGFYVGCRPTFLLLRHQKNAYIFLSCAKSQRIRPFIPLKNAIKRYSRDFQ